MLEQFKDLARSYIDAVNQSSAVICVGASSLLACPVVSHGLGIAAIAKENEQLKSLSAAFFCFSILSRLAICADAFALESYEYDCCGKGLECLKVVSLGWSLATLYLSGSLFSFAHSDSNTGSDASESNFKVVQTVFGQVIPLIFLGSADFCGRSLYKMAANKGYSRTLAKGLGWLIPGAIGIAIATAAVMLRFIHIAAFALGVYGVSRDDQLAKILSGVFSALGTALFGMYHCWQQALCCCLGPRCETVLLAASTATTLMAFVDEQLADVGFTISGISLITFYAAVFCCPSKGGRHMASEQDSQLEEVPQVRPGSGGQSKNPDPDNAKRTVSFEGLGAGNREKKGSFNSAGLAGPQGKGDSPLEDPLLATAR